MKGFTLAQYPDKVYPWEVLRDIHQPPPVPAEALQQSLVCHLSSGSTIVDDKKED